MRMVWIVSSIAYLMATAIIGGRAFAGKGRGWFIGFSAKGLRGILTQRRRGAEKRGGAVLESFGVLGRSYMYNGGD